MKASVYQILSEEEQADEAAADAALDEYEADEGLDDA